MDIGRILPTEAAAILNVSPQFVRVALKEEANWTFEDAEPYIESLIAFYQDHHQTTFRVMEASEVRRLQRIPCRQVLQEIFNGKFIELKNGMLRYKR